MKSIVILLFIVLTPLYSFAQDTIDVVEKTIKIGGLSREVEYDGFAEGDKVIFNLIVENKKDLKDITISEYPNSVKFAEHESKLIQNKVLNIARNGIYVFEYYNSNISGRTIHVKIQRVPKSESTKYFNTNIKWVNAIDTSYTTKENTILISSDTSFVNVIDSKVWVHSQTNRNPNKTIVDFTIPMNTIKWTYWIGVGNEGQEAFQQDQTNFSKTGASIIGTINPLAGFAFELFTMTQATGGENVKYYFMRTLEDAQNFMGVLEFMQFKSGDIITDSGLINFGAKTNEKFYIGLENDNVMQGIDVTVKILAVVVTNKYEKVFEKIPIYTNKSIPVNVD